MTLTDWTNIAQSIAVLGALIIAVIEVRKSVREQRFRNYLDSMSGFLYLSKLMVENKNLHGLYDYSTKDLTKSYNQLSGAEKTRIHYCDTLIALCETVWVASKEGWISEGEWAYWKRWIHDLNNSREFRWTVKWVQGEYDEDFRKSLLRRAGSTAG